jgi:hypothetical protein
MMPNDNLTKMNKMRYVNVLKISLGNETNAISFLGCTIWRKIFAQTAVGRYTTEFTKCYFLVIVTSHTGNFGIFTSDCWFPRLP